MKLQLRLTRAPLGLAICCLLLANTVSAQDQEPIVAVGQALVVDDNTEAAQMRALLDALRTAATQSAGQVSSHSMVNADGQLTENVSLQSDLNIRHMEILEQGFIQGIARVKVALTIDHDNQTCSKPKLTQVVTTDLATPKANYQHSQVDINQLLLNAEAHFSERAQQVNFSTYRINSALSTYEAASLASEAYNQADYHLTIGAQWLLKPKKEVLGWNLLNKLSPLMESSSAPKIVLTAAFSSPNIPAINVTASQQFSLPEPRSIAESSQPIPLTLQSQVNGWIQHTWQDIYSEIQCAGSFVTVSNIIDQPLWRMNKGARLGLKQGQQLLVLPQNYKTGILNPDSNSAPVVLKVTQLEPHSALLEHLAGPKDFATGVAQIVIF
ncbi:MAG TPA: hypothetical protein DE045_01150 [Oceanospirillaceae bacterium]|nr:hypothetical protein [Oceanospirillaceae bacterium]